MYKYINVLSDYKVMVQIIKYRTQWTKCLVFLSRQVLLGMVYALTYARTSLCSSQSLNLFVWKNLCLINFHNLICIFVVHTIWLYSEMPWPYNCSLIFIEVLSKINIQMMYFCSCLCCYIFINSFSGCVFVCDTYMTLCAYGGQRTTCWSQFSPSTTEIIRHGGMCPSPVICLANPDIFKPINSTRYKRN